MVESQIVILAVAGSNPVGHPNFPSPTTRTTGAMLIRRGWTG